MLHSSNTGITQELEDVSDLSYGIGATTTQSCVRMEPKEISITQLLQHEVLFVMVFPEALPNDVKDAYASFGDMLVVKLKKKNDFNLIGTVPGRYMYQVFLSFPLLGSSVSHQAFHSMPSIT